MRGSAERGQALIYGMFFLSAGLAALFFLFNTGQLTREKTKLVNTADAAAFSAGIMNARMLNYQAYNNRAMVANTVAIAQLVSASSWVNYIYNMSQYGFVLDNVKWNAYFETYFIARDLGPRLQDYLNDHERGALERLASASDDIVRSELMHAQQIAYTSMPVARLAVMNDVAKANYRDDGSVVVEPMTLRAVEDFVTPYSGDERKRFAEVAKTAANRDTFVPKRSWFWPASYSDCPGATPRVDWLDRRGGTELLGFDEWRAMDTLSEKRWAPRNKYDVFCTAVVENPAAWSALSAAQEPTVDIDPRHYDYAVPINPGASALALVTSKTWNYSGLPGFYELSEDALSQSDPRVRFAVRLTRDKGQTLTSEARSAISPSAHLNAYQAQPAGGSLVAVSGAEVFFERSGDARDNEYGASLGRPREIGSLFNPFWQVHLIQPVDEIRAAQATQGVVLPP